MGCSASGPDKDFLIDTRQSRYVRDAHGNILILQRRYKQSVGYTCVVMRQPLRIGCIESPAHPQSRSNIEGTCVSEIQ